MGANYQFKADKIFQIKLTGKFFFLPDVSNFDTIILKINVESENIFKYFSLPFLMLKTKNFKQKYFLQKHNRGIRYFDITNCKNIIGGSDKIFLASNKLHFSSDINLICFNNNIANDVKVLVIAPHPDDAELAAFNFYRKHNSVIVTITAGEDGPNFYQKYYSNDRKKQYILKGKMRVFDSITTPLLGNVTSNNAINLGYFDNTIYQMWKDPDKTVISNYTEIDNVDFFRSKNSKNFIKMSRCQVTWHNLVADLKEVIEKVKPDIIVLPHPELDSHKDHKYVAHAVFAATKKISCKGSKYFFYITHATFSERYPYGPKHSAVTLPFNKNRLRSNYKIYSSLLSNEEQIGKEMAINTMHDLRYPPDQICSIINSFKHAVLPRFKEINAWHDYYRRFVRANEIFLVQEIE